jgi:hypothetical protein
MGLPLIHGLRHDAFIDAARFAAHVGHDIVQRFGQAQRGVILRLLADLGKDVGGGLALERGGKTLAHHVAGDDDIFDVDAAFLAELALGKLGHDLVGLRVEGLKPPDGQVCRKGRRGKGKDGAGDQAAK